MMDADLLGAVAPFISISCIGEIDLNLRDKGADLWTFWVLMDIPSPSTPFSDLRSQFAHYINSFASKEDV